VSSLLSEAFLYIVIIASPVTKGQVTGNGKTALDTAHKSAMIQSGTQAQLDTAQNELNKIVLKKAEGAGAKEAAVALGYIAKTIYTEELQFKIRNTRLTVKHNEARLTWGFTF
jgi:hypothetical protein